MRHSSRVHTWFEGKWRLVYEEAVRWTNDCRLPGEFRNFIISLSPFQHNKETEGPTNGQPCTKPLWALSPKRNPLRKELTACPPRVRTPSILRHVSRRESAIFHRRCKGEATDFRRQRN
ncbi:hypothetical protein YC2023_007006 [Brassica napus]